MHLSPHSLQQIDDAYIESLDPEALRGWAKTAVLGSPALRTPAAYGQAQCQPDIEGHPVDAGLAAGAEAWSLRSDQRRLLRPGTLRASASPCPHSQKFVC